MGRLGCKHRLVWIKSTEGAVSDHHWAPLICPLVNTAGPASTYGGGDCWDSSAPSAGDFAPWQRLGTSLLLSRSVTVRFVHCQNTGLVCVSAPWWTWWTGEFGRSPHTMGRDRCDTNGILAMWGEVVAPLVGVDGLLIFNCTVSCWLGYSLVSWCRLHSAERGAVVTFWTEREGERILTWWHIVRDQRTSEAISGYKCVSVALLAEDYVSVMLCWDQRVQFRGDKVQLGAKSCPRVCCGQCSNCCIRWGCMLGHCSFKCAHLWWQVF